MFQTCDESLAEQRYIKFSHFNYFDLFWKISFLFLIILFRFEFGTVRVVEGKNVIGPIDQGDHFNQI